MANTKCRKRKLDALEVANNIEVARRGLGTLGKVAESSVLSYEMIRQIHSVLKCTDRVKKLVKQRRLDSFDILHRLSKLSPPDQNSVAGAVIAGDIDSDDVRGIVNLRNDFARLPIKRIIERIQASRNIKEYIAYFIIPGRKYPVNLFESRFAKALGTENIISLHVGKSTRKGHVGVLVLNSEGKRRLQESANREGMTKRRFLDELVGKGAK